jgi:hypothetical protein
VARRKLHVTAHLSAHFLVTGVDRVIRVIKACRVIRDIRIVRASRVLWIGTI